MHGRGGFHPCSRAAARMPVSTRSLNRLLNLYVGAMPNDDPQEAGELWEERIRRKPSIRRVVIWTGIIVAVTGITGFTLRDLIGLPWGSDPQGARVLTPDSPVRVTWTGVADTLELVWSEVEDPELHNYSVDVEALAPIEGWYNVGYRFGEELRTTAIANPIAELNERLKEQDATDRTDFNQVWRVCVYAMRDAPGGVDISSYVIQGATQCSDQFTIPEPTS